MKETVSVVVYDDAFERDIKFFLQERKSEVYRITRIAERYESTGRDASDARRLIEHLQEDIEWFKGELIKLIEDDKYPGIYKTILSRK